MDARLDQPTHQLTTLVSIRRVEAVLNPAAGGVGPDSDQALKTVLDEFGLDSHVVMPDPGMIEDALRSAIEAKPDLLIVVAGDGTAGRAAELCGPDGPMLAPLPGGTMNMLPHALYGPVSWRDALVAALTHGQERMVSGGEISGRRFYCAAILGSPAFWQPAREAARAGDIRRAWRKAVVALRRAFMTRLRFQVEGRPSHKAVALSLICPLVSRALDCETALEAAGLDIQDAVQVFRLALNNLLGDWRRDPGVITEAALNGRAWAKRPIPCLVDGELHWLEREVSFQFRPEAFRALAPAAPTRGAS